MNTITCYEEFIKNNNLYLMNYYLTQYQFSEEILIRTRVYYDSNVCLNTQNNLSPYFCFYYLYNSDYDSADIFTDYNDIIRYYTKKDGTSITLINQLENIFYQVTRERKI